MSDVTREQITDKAREYIGTKYMHQGRVKGEAIDCAGLLLCVCHELNIIDPEFDFTEYDRINDGFHLRRIIDLHCFEVEREDVLPGDVCIMRMYQNPQHCGFFSPIGLIQCTKTVVEHRIDQKWENKIVSCHRMNIFE